MPLKLHPANMLCNSLELKLDLFAGDLSSVFPAACSGKVDQGQEEVIPLATCELKKNKQSNNLRPHEWLV